MSTETRRRRRGRRKTPPTIRALLRKVKRQTSYRTTEVRSEVHRHQRTTPERQPTDSRLRLYMTLGRHRLDRRLRLRRRRQRHRRPRQTTRVRGKHRQLTRRRSAGWLESLEAMQTVRLMDLVPREAMRAKRLLTWKVTPGRCRDPIGTNVQHAEKGSAPRTLHTIISGRSSIRSLTTMI